MMIRFHRLLLTRLLLMFIDSLLFQYFTTVLLRSWLSSPQIPPSWPAFEPWASCPSQLSWQSPRGWSGTLQWSFAWGQPWWLAWACIQGLSWAPRGKNHSGSCIDWMEPRTFLPGFKGKHPVSKDSIHPVHDNVCLVWLRFILLPDGLVELGHAHLLLDLGEQEMKIENVYFYSWWSLQLRFMAADLLGKDDILKNICTFNLIFQSASPHSNANISVYFYCFWKILDIFEKRIKRAV